MTHVTPPSFDGLELALPEFDSPPSDPIALLGDWLASAVEAGVREPGAFVLATADADGRPSSRTLTLKEIDTRGLVFTTQSASAKGVELEHRPWASATLYWRETGQQANLGGPVARLDPEASDALFAERHRGAQATTAASRQSAELTDAVELESAAALILASDGPIARPAGWFGYRLEPERIEFWHAHPDRLHRRLRYERSADAGWTATRLQP